MSLQNYFLEKFLDDAGRLHSEPVNSLLLRRPGKFLLDENTRFFGGKDWKNCRSDLSRIENKAAFVSCGFAAVCTDLNMQMAWPEEYPPWRSVVYVPCFGWQDFRPCYEAPEKLLSVPLELGLIRLDELNATELAETWFTMLKKYFDTFIVYLQYPDFLEAMLKKRVFHEENPQLGDFFICLRQEMEKRVSTL